MNERDLEYFAVVAKHGHLGRAAETLDLSQPALSTSLRRLEKSVQAKLVKRTPKGVVLTTVGSALVSHLGRLRLAREDVTREMADLSQGRAGDLRVAVYGGTAEDLLAAAGTAILNDAPKVTLKVTVSTSDLTMPGLRNGEFDLIIGSGPPGPHEDLAQEHLLYDEYIVYASAKHRLAGRKRVTLADLAGERWVRPASGPSWRGLVQVFEQNGLPPPRFSLESNSMAVRRHAVAFGGLLAIGIRRRVLEYARRLPVVELPVKVLSAPRKVVVAYRKDGYLSPAARRFIEILKSTAREISKEH